MRKTYQDSSKKYAFNINDPHNEFRNLLPINLKKLTKGLYDDLEENDCQIKSKTKLLRKIKDDSIKEFIFTNREIPEHWKKKLNYQNDVIKMFVKDGNFLAYVGKGPAVEPPPPVFADGPAGGGPASLSENRITSYRKDFIKNKNKIVYSNDLIEKEHEELTSNINSSKNMNAKYKINKKGFLNDKDIILLLEEFKNAYPLIDQKPITDKKKIRKEKIIEKNNSSIFNRTHNLSIPFLSNNQDTYDQFSNIRKMKLEKRQEVFRQSIFNNLIPPKKKLHSCKSAITRMEKNKESNGLFFNYDLNGFDKKIEIKNSLIKKNLENINYYGPYYSYCPKCRNRNIEFYNKLEAGQCMKIIQYIKKIIGMKNFLNLKKRNNEPTEEDQKEKNNKKKILSNVKLHNNELYGESENGKVPDKE